MVSTGAAVEGAAAQADAAAVEGVEGEEQGNGWIVHSVVFLAIVAFFYNFVEVKFCWK